MSQNTYVNNTSSSVEINEFLKACICFKLKLDVLAALLNYLLKFRLFFIEVE